MLICQNVSDIHLLYLAIYFNVSIAIWTYHHSVFQFKKCHAPPDSGNTHDITRF